MESFFCPSHCEQWWWNVLQLCLRCATCNHELLFKHCFIRTMVQSISCGCAGTLMTVSMGYSTLFSVKQRAVLSPLCSNTVHTSPCLAIHCYSNKKGYISACFCFSVSLPKNYAALFCLFALYKR